MPTVCSLKRTICHYAPSGVLHVARPAWGLGTCSVPIMGSFSSSWRLQTQFLSSSCLSPPLAAVCHLSEEESQLSLSHWPSCKESVSQIKLCHVSLHLTLAGQSEEARFLIQRPQGIISEKGFVKGQWGDQLSHTTNTIGIPWRLNGKEPTCNVGDLGSIPELGRSPGEGKGYPLQYSGLENSMDYIVHGLIKSRTRLSDYH